MGFHMRVAWVAALGVLILSTAAQADDIFLCEDGTHVTIRPTSPVCRLEHPCVRSWSANDARRRSSASQVPGSQADAGIVRRTSARDNPPNCPDEAPPEVASTATGGIMISLPIDGELEDIQPDGSLPEALCLRSYIKRDGTRVCIEHAETPSSAWSGGLSVSGSRHIPGIDVRVRPYFRKDGTFVRGHTRAAPGRGTRRR
jgi:hypothetical protein